MAAYSDIAQDLARRIVDGEFARGRVLPPEHELARRYCVARGTVRSALGVLARRGMVAPRQGAGWIVQTAPPTHGFAQLRSFAQWAESRGLSASGRVVSSERRPPSPEERSVLGGGDVLRVVRIRSLEAADVMIERTSYPSWLAPSIESLPDDEASVVQAMERRFGVVPVHADHTIDAVAASSADAALLAVRRSSPLLRMRRRSYGRDGRAIEIGEDRYLPTSMAFQVHATLASTPLGRVVE